MTNDFPPRKGGIQTYLEGFARELDPDSLVVYCSSPPDGGADEYDSAQPWTTIRYPGTVMLPIPSVRREMQRIIREQSIEAVWFGASTPLGLMAKAAKAAGAGKVISTTHGHEVGWARVPAGRLALRKIFHDADVVTYISDYTLGRLRPHMPHGQQVLRLPSGIDVERFRPDAEARSALRARYGLGEAPTVVCVSRLVARKGQDSLIEAWPRVAERLPGARLVIVGWGSYARRLALLKRHSPARDSIILTGKVPYDELPGHVAMGDVFAMPCRTRGGGLDVEGLGIVFLEASAAGLPVIAGTSGGAPETVEEGVTGNVVDGRDQDALVEAIVRQLSDAEMRARMGAAGRELMIERWTWPSLVERLVGAINER